MSELTEYSPDQDELFSDPVEYFSYLFYNFGGTGIPYEASPCLNPSAASNLDKSVFANLDWKFESEPPTIEGSTPNYEIESISGTPDSGWDYSYRFLVTFYVPLKSNTLEEAMMKLRVDALEYLAVFDGGVEEIMNVEEVRLFLQSSQ